MVSGIRGRLLLSYVLLLGVTLMVTAVALIFLLSSRAAFTPGEIHRDLLGFAAEQVRENRMRYVLLSLQDDVVLSETPLAAAASTSSVRVMIVNPQDNTVIEDSLGAYAAGDVMQIDEVGPLNPRDAENWDQQRRSLNPGEGRGGPRRPGLQFELTPDRLRQGEFTDDGAQWLFLQAELPTGILRNDVEPLTIMLAQHQSTVPLFTAIEQFRDSLSIALLQAGFAGVAVSTFLAIVVSQMFGRPLKTLSEAALAVAEGDYSQRVPEEAGPREIRNVAQAFNQMSRQVELTNQAQRDLLASVSHDLRTPLTSIQGYSQAIIDGTAPDSTRAASIIHDEADRLNRLVQQLMELSRLKSGHLAMRQDALNLTEMVGALIEKIDVVAKQKGLTITSKLHPTDPVTGDGDRLAQVVTNLLSNAVKYTPEGGKIGVLVDQNEGCVRVTVKDTGVGISAEDLSRVFERFYQADKSRGQGGGYGLGLAIVKEIVIAHNGSITVDSPGTGKGTTSTVRLPRQVQS
jgi:signal transduction histidine kinase